MAQLIYTPLGDMKTRLDFYDQPTDPNPDDGTPAVPVLFASGVYCKLTAVSQTTKASKEPQQVVTELTHWVITRYAKGFRSRMYILYNDPDRTDDDGNLVPRRFDIDRMYDPDEQKVELHFLCIERNDGN